MSRNGVVQVNKSMAKRQRLLLSTAANTTGAADGVNTDSTTSPPTKHSSTRSRRTIYLRGMRESAQSGKSTPNGIRYSKVHLRGNKAVPTMIAKAQPSLTRDETRSSRERGFRSISGRCILLRDAKSRD